MFDTAASCDSVCVSTRPANGTTLRRADPGCRSSWTARSDARRDRPSRSSLVITIWSPALTVCRRNQRQPFGELAVRLIEVQAAGSRPRSGSQTGPRGVLVAVETRPLPIFTVRRIAIGCSRDVVVYTGRVPTATFGNSAMSISEFVCTATRVRLHTVRFSVSKFVCTAARVPLHRQPTVNCHRETADRTEVCTRQRGTYRSRRRRVCAPAASSDTAMMRLSPLTMSIIWGYSESGTYISTR